MTFVLTSDAFHEGGDIPNLYTCDGKDISPQLKWSEAPEGTKSFALIMDDPDAPVGNWDHWLLFNIPPTINELKEDIKSLPDGVGEGRNSWEKTGYGGPCPPDKEHRYFFKLYALDATINHPNGITKSQLEEAMEGHILAETQLMGHYDRPR